LILSVIFDLVMKTSDKLDEQPQSTKGLAPNGTKPLYSIYV
jgi:hypothetical protein